MGRIAVIGDLPLLYHHNKYAECDNNPQLYFDFGRARFLSRDSDTSEPLSYMMAKDFDITEFPSHQVKNLSDEECLLAPNNRNWMVSISKEIDERYPVIALNVHNDFFDFRTHHRRSEGLRAYVPFSPEATKLAEQVVQKIIKHDSPGINNNYCCLKLRRGDRVKAQKLGYFARFYRDAVSSAKNVMSNLDDHELVNENTPIYLMTDESEEGYYDSLCEKYRVYQYKDFPELYRLVHPSDGRVPNNYFLYAVEMQIYLWANIRIYNKLKDDHRELLKNLKYRAYKFMGKRNPVNRYPSDGGYDPSNTFVAGPWKARLHSNRFESYLQLQKSSKLFKAAIVALSLTRRPISKRLRKLFR